jgi:hypothetical protein
MKTKPALLSIFALTILMVSACSGVTATPDARMEHPTEEAMMDEPTQEAMVGETPAAEEPMMESPAWYSANLTDASTGEIFSIESLKGKVILVESMAVWCSKCLRQQEQVKILHETLGVRDDFVSVGLDIDPNENIDQLKNYVEAKGFDWYYAISPVDVSREIASLYGDQFLNPPSTPIVVIDRHGVAHPTSFGMKSAEDLLKFIQPFLDESM